MKGPLRVFLADDEPLALERLVFAFRDIPDTEVVGTATNGHDAAVRIAELAPDVAILDIQMPGRTGLGIAAGLGADRRAEIVFVTAHEHHAVDAFDVEASDYLLKPLRVDRLRVAIERIRRRRAVEVGMFDTAAPLGLAGAPPEDTREPGPVPSADVIDACFWVPTRGGPVRVDYTGIDWIEAAKDYVLLHTATRSHIVRATMSAIATRVTPAQFVRVHRSAFVRPGAVRALRETAAGGAVLELADAVAVAVGPSYLPEVRRRFVRRP